MEKGNFYGQMVDAMLEHGLMVSSKVMVHTTCQTNLQNMVYGLMGKGHNG